MLNVSHWKSVILFTVSNAGDARPDAHEGPVDAADDAGAHVGDGLVQAAVQHAVGGGGPHQGGAGQSEGSITVACPPITAHLGAGARTRG